VLAASSNWPAVGGRYRHAGCVTHRIGCLWRLARLFRPGEGPGFRVIAGIPGCRGCFAGWFAVGAGGVYCFLSRREEDSEELDAGAANPL
jgi:hypothetical protein